MERRWEYGIMLLTRRFILSIFFGITVLLLLDNIGIVLPNYLALINGWLCWGLAIIVIERK